MTEKAAGLKWKYGFETELPNKSASPADTQGGLNLFDKYMAFRLEPMRCSNICRRAGYSFATSSRIFDASFLFVFAGFSSLFPFSTAADGSQRRSHGETTASFDDNQVRPRVMSFWRRDRWTVMVSGCSLHQCLVFRIGTFKYSLLRDKGNTLVVLGLINCVKSRGFSSIFSNYFLCTRIILGFRKYFSAPVLSSGLQNIRLKRDFFGDFEVIEVENRGRFSPR